MAKFLRNLVGTLQSGRKISVASCERNHDPRFCCLSKLFYGREIDKLRPLGKMQYPLGTYIDSDKLYFHMSCSFSNRDG